MTSEVPGPSQPPTGSIEGGFLPHPGDERVIRDYMGVVMPEEDAAIYDNGGEDDNSLDEQRTTPATLVSAEQKKDEVVTVLDKLRVVQEQFGFVPQSREELNEIWRVRKHLDKFGGSATDLNILLLHQSNPKIKTDDPQALLKNKVRTWGGYFREATSNRNLITDVGEFIAKHQDMTTPEVMKYYKDTVAYSERALRPIKATGILPQLAASQDVEVAIAKNPFEYVDTIWKESLGSIDRNKLKDIALEAYVMNNKRHDFWLKALEQARRHDVVRFLVADYIGPERPPDR